MSRIPFVLFVLIMVSGVLADDLSSTPPRTGVAPRVNPYTWSLGLQASMMTSYGICIERRFGERVGLRIGGLGYLDSEDGNKRYLLTGLLEGRYLLKRISLVDMNVFAGVGRVIDMDKEEYSDYNGGEDYHMEGTNRVGFGISICFLGINNLDFEMQLGQYYRETHNVQGLDSSHSYRFGTGVGACLSYRF